MIDLYHQHRIDRSVPIEDVAGAVADLIKEGKVRYFGLSEVAADTIRRAHRVCPVTTVQSEYHLMFRKPETEVFSTLQELGIWLTAYSPINRGFLGGTLTEYADMNTNDIRGAWPRFTREALRANTRILEVLNEFGKTRGMTSSQIALAWMMSKHPFIVPLFGTTKLSHLEEDLRAADFTLSADESLNWRRKFQRSRSWVSGTMPCNSREWNTKPTPQTPDDVANAPSARSRSPMVVVEPVELRKVFRACTNKHSVCSGATFIVDRANGLPVRYQSHFTTSSAIISRTSGSSFIVVSRTIGKPTFRHT